LQTNEWENVEPCEQYLLEKNVSIDEAKLFDQYENLYEIVLKQHETNAIYCKMLHHETWAKNFAPCNGIECFSELIKIAQFYLSVMARYTVKRIFSLMQPQT